MTEFENKIYQIISQNNGIKGSEIAAKLGVEKRAVNSELANSHSLKALVRQESNFKWYLINQGQVSGNKIESLPDEDLKNLCNYYLNCISMESNNLVSQFLDSKFDLKYAVAGSLDLKESCNGAILALLNRINSDKEKKAFFGYPVHIYSIYSRDGKRYQRIAPIFLFPVDYIGGAISVSKVPTINMDVLKAFCDSSTEAIKSEWLQLERDLGMDTPDQDVDIDELILRLRNIRQWNWKENIDPYNIPKEESLKGFEDGIYNRPIVIEAEKEMYTQGLESELMTLANMPEQNYKGTALYSWIKGDFSPEKEESIKPLLEVLPLNAEQAESVETALRSKLTIVTGPPGTGKSQVVTDLLINIAWNGKSVLFSSKNNKAVDVVDARVNALSRRPVLLRIGSNQYAARLSELIEGLLNTRPTRDDKAESDFYLQEYEKKTTAVKNLKQKKQDLIRKRNLLDELEQKYCEVRDIITPFYDVISDKDTGVIARNARIFKSAFDRTIKEKQNFWDRLFWFALKSGRIKECDAAAEVLNKSIEKYSLPQAYSGITESEAQSVVESAEKFEEALAVAVQYKNTLQALENAGSLEGIDKLIVGYKDSLAAIAEKLWDKLQISRAVEFSSQDRMEMSNFVAAMKLTGDVDISSNTSLKQQYTKMTKKMTAYLKCWAVTSLSAKSKVPFSAGAFDYVIIDEASQCDIASILPLLYRAKRAVIIGDPKQLSHISQLSKEQDIALLQRYAVPPAWSYSANSLYMLAAGKVSAESIVQLKDHFRSCADIIEFSNEYFYDGTLRTATKYTKLKTPSGEKPGVRWIDVKGKIIRPQSGSAYNDEEIKAVVGELKRLVESGYQGTLGVTTPFRLQADKIKEYLEKKESALYQQLLCKHEFIADPFQPRMGENDPG